jgi:hypothetical protein
LLRAGISSIFRGEFILMKAAWAISFVVFVFCTAANSLRAQQFAASEQALLYADSLHHAYQSKDWNRYIDLSYPGMIEYFGGQRRFRDYLQRSADLKNEHQATMQIHQLVNEDNNWQCVIKKVTRSLVDGKKATVVTYIIGQSKDRGNTWQFVDVAFASTRNLYYIMPDMSASLIIPERNVVFDPPMALN